MKMGNVIWITQYILARAISVGMSIYKVWFSWLFAKLTLKIQGKKTFQQKTSLLEASKYTNYKHIYFTVVYRIVEEHWDQLGLELC